MVSIFEYANNISDERINNGWYNNEDIIIWNVFTLVFIQIHLISNFLFENFTLMIISIDTIIWGSNISKYICKQS